MSLKKINNKQNKLDNENYSNIILNILNEIDEKSKILSIKDIEIKENIRSIKLKEKKVDKINQTIMNKKEELKLIKELFLLKEKKNMNIKDIMDSYIDFLISSNDTLDNKLNSLFQREININSKQKYINKLLGEDKNENDFDYIYENINRPIDISKFLIKKKKKKSIHNYNDYNENKNKNRENGGENILKNLMSDIDNCNNNNNNNNNNNLYQSKKNKISSSSSYEKLSNGIKWEEIPYNNKYKNNKNKEKINNKINDSNFIHFKNNADSLNKYEKFISPRNINDNSKNNYYKNNNNQKYNNDIKINDNKNNFNNNFNKTYKDKYNHTNANLYHRNMNKEKTNFAKTDTNYFNNYNLKPNNKLKKAREIFKRLLNKLKKSNELFFTYTSNNNNKLENFISNVLCTNYFLRKVLSIIYECSEIYNPNNKRTITETIHDSEFLSQLNNNEISDEENEIEDINNILLYEKGLEEIKKITKETKQLQDKISQFVYKINITE